MSRLLFNLESIYFCFTIRSISAVRWQFSVCCTSSVFSWRFQCRLLARKRKHRFILAAEGYICRLVNKRNARPPASSQHANVATFCAAAFQWRKHTSREDSQRSCRNLKMFDISSPVSHITLFWNRRRWSGLQSAWGPSTMLIKQWPC